jgi:HK97 family phage major capsid protein
MEQEIFNKAMDAIKADAVKEASAATADQIKSFADELAQKGATIEEIKGELNEFKKKQGQLHLGEQKAKSVIEQISEAVIAKKDDLSSLQENMKGSVNFSVKAAATMTTSNYSGGTVGLTQWDPSFTQVARRNPFLRQLVSVRPVSKQYVAWAEQANRDGGAGNTAEGAAKTQADFDIVEANKKVEKITAYSKASKESLDDISFLQSEIYNDLLSLVNLKLDTDLLSGSGTTPVIKGIQQYATSFSVASTVLANGIDNATEFDVLRAAIWQVENAYFQPNYIVLNPIDVAKIDMLKDTTNQYIQAGSASQFPVKMFYGLPVIANNGMTAGNFLVGDFSKSNLGIREEVNIQVGYENDDFTKNLITILAEMRAVHDIKSNHTGAFVKGVFSTAKSALETA